VRYATTSPVVGVRWEKRAAFAAFLICGAGNLDDQAQGQKNKTPYGIKPLPLAFS
jgi:hypothetical protein